MFLEGQWPVLVGVCETWFAPAIQFRLKGYSTLRADRPGRVGGGLAVMVREDVPCQPFTLTPFPEGVLEVLALQLELASGWASVMVAYNPCLSVFQAELDHYFTQLLSPSLVMGDFNARHPFWDPVLPPRSVNASGSSLYRFLLGSAHFSLLSPSGMQSRIDPHSGLASTLDLYLGAHFQGADYSLGPYLGSDHLPLLASFPNLSVNLPHPTRPRWRLSACLSGGPLPSKPYSRSLPGGGCQSLFSMVGVCGPASLHLVLPPIATPVWSSLVDRCVS